MRPHLHNLFAMLLISLTVGGLLVFATDPLLYTVKKDPGGSAFHTNPDSLDDDYVSSAADLVPLMQEMIDGGEPIVRDIQFRDSTAVQNRLAMSEERLTSLEGLLLDLDLNGGEIGSFLAAMEEQDSTLSELMDRITAFDTVQRVGAQEENRNNLQLQASVARQSALLQRGIRVLAERYVHDHETVLGISTRLDFDTRKYREALSRVKSLTAEIEGKELPVPETTSVQEDGITFYIYPETAAYRNTIQVFGVVYPPGTEQVVSLLLDETIVATTQSDRQGNYRTAYTIGSVPAGTHRLTARSGDVTSVGRELVIPETGSSIALTAAPVIVNRWETGALCNGSLMANYPVRNAPVRIFTDGIDSGEITTTEDGTFSVFLPLPPRSYSLRAVFSPGDLPLSASMSDDVPVTVWAPLFNLPDPSTMDRILQVMAVLLVGAVLVILAADAGGVLRLPKRKENTEAARIQERIEEMLRTADRKTGSDAAFQAAISNLLDQYWAALTKDGLSEAARQAYLTLAGRIAQSLGLHLGYRTLTPREMTEYCSGEHYASFFTRFVSNYEKIRYGSSNSEKDRIGFERALQNAYQEFGSDRY